MNLRGIALRLGLVAVGLGAGALTLEIGLRCKVAFDNYRVRQAGYVTPKGPVAAGQMVKFNENPRLIYDLRPNIDVEFMSVNVKTNAEGFRDVDHPLERPPGIRHRAVCLGDSYMFGWGVNFEQGYVRVAADQMKDWEFINLGRPGYNAAQEIECFRVYGLKYKPDVVIINYIGNDTQLPFYIQRTPDDMSASFLMDWICGQLSRDGLQMAPTIFLDKEKKQFKYEDDPARVPAKYKDLVGWSAVERSYRELGEMARENHFKVVLLCFPHRDDRVIPFAKADGYEICDFTPKLVEVMKANNIAEYQDSDLCLPKPDTHPAPKLHKLGGDFLAEYLRKSFP
ncbi:SGNH/GDSL hydrolase family protein [bacterium]|nr:SGNH/GDSL hydrolase family protein [bacterium]